MDLLFKKIANGPEVSGAHLNEQRQILACSCESWNCSFDSQNDIDLSITIDHFAQAQHWRCSSETMKGNSRFLTQSNSSQHVD